MALFSHVVDASNGTVAEGCAFLGRGRLLEEQKESSRQASRLLLERHRGLEARGLSSVGQAVRTSLERSSQSRRQQQERARLRSTAEQAGGAAELARHLLGGTHSDTPPRPVLLYVGKGSMVRSSGGTGPRSGPPILRQLEIELRRRRVRSLVVRTGEAFTSSVCSCQGCRDGQSQRNPYVICISPADLTKPANCKVTAVQGAGSGKNERVQDLPPRFLPDRAEDAAPRRSRRHQHCDQRREAEGVWPSGVSHRRHRVDLAQIANSYDLAPAPSSPTSLFRRRISPHRPETLSCLFLNTTLTAPNTLLLISTTRLCTHYLLLPPCSLISCFVFLHPLRLRSLLSEECSIHCVHATLHMRATQLSSGRLPTYGICRPAARGRKEAKRGHGDNLGGP